MVNLLDKHLIKMTVLKMFQELKENAEKVKKTMTEQNGNNNKEVGDLKESKKKF